MLQQVSKSKQNNSTCDKPRIYSKSVMSSSLESRKPLSINGHISEHKPRKSPLRRKGRIIDHAHILSQIIAMCNLQTDLAATKKRILPTVRLQSTVSWQENSWKEGYFIIPNDFKEVCIIIFKY